MWRNKLSRKWHSLLCLSLSSSGARGHMSSSQGFNLHLPLITGKEGRWGQEQVEKWRTGILHHETDQWPKYCIQMVSSSAPTGADNENDHKTPRECPGSIWRRWEKKLKWATFVLGFSWYRWSECVFGCDKRCLSSWGRCPGPCWWGLKWL